MGEPFAVGIGMKTQVAKNKKISSSFLAYLNGIGITERQRCVAPRRTSTNFVSWQRPNPSKRWDQVSYTSTTKSQTQHGLANMGSSFARIKYNEHHPLPSSQHNIG